MMICHECYADEALILSFGFNKRQVDHRGPKYEVVKTVLRLDDRIGLVDEDPGQNQSADYKRFVTIHEEHDIKVVRHDGKSIIVLGPRLEEWILRTARLARIDVRDYGLPNDPMILHDVINDEIDKLDRLLEALGDHQRMRTLGRLLKDQMASRTRD